MPDLVPELEIVGEEDRAERMARLLRALDVMGSIVRIAWPDEDSTVTDPDAVRWRGAFDRLCQEGGHLHVAWKDEDHWDKYAKVVELAWNAIGCEGGCVIHHNTDPQGLKLPRTELMF